MKFDKAAIRSLIFVFIFCIFIGVTVISIGIGSVLPSINYIAKPLVCPTGPFSYNQIVSHPYPGATYVTGSWTCTDSSSGSQAQIGLINLGLIVGPFYGLLLFLLVFRTWYQFTLSGQQKKGADADWQRKWNAEFGSKSRHT
jgi:hypothetical protein